MDLFNFDVSAHDTEFYNYSGTYYCKVCRSRYWAVQTHYILFFCLQAEHSTDCDI